MIDVTDKAAAVLGESLEASREKDSDVLRLAQQGDGYGLALSEERADDQKVQHEDRTVLVVEPGISQALDGATLGVEETPEGPRLALQPPPSG